MKITLNGNCLAILENQMAIRRRRFIATQTWIDNAPLTDEEEAALQRIRQTMIEKSGMPTAEAQILWQSIIDTYGARMVLNSFVEPTLVMGVHYWYFVINAIACMFVFINTQSFSVLLIAAPFIHALGYLYQRVYGPRARQEKINHILTKGFIL